MMLSDLATFSASTKKRNISAILYTLLYNSYVSRAGLAQRTQLSPTTISNLVTELLNSGLVEEDLTVSNRRHEGVGRPRRALRLIPESRYAVGVYLRVGKVEIGITDLRARVLHTRVFSYDKTAGPEVILQYIARQIETVLAESAIPVERVVGVGVGLNGSVDPITGVNLYAPGLDWHHIPAQALLADHLPFPVCVDNNVRLMALGEAVFNKRPNIQHIALIQVHDGLGAGLIINGEILRGAHATAGEIGHTTILVENGKRCGCGGTGCLDTLISANALLEDAALIAQEHGQTELAQCLTSAEPGRLDRLFDEARHGNLPVLNLLQQRARYLGIVLANLLNLLNPELLLLAGSVYVKGQDIMLTPTREAMLAQAFGDLGSRVKLEVVAPDRNIAVIGAAGFALKTYFYSQGLEEVLQPNSEVTAM